MNSTFGGGIHAYMQRCFMARDVGFDESGHLVEAMEEEESCQ